MKEAELDISFGTEEMKFNYRACAIIIRGDRVLAMRDERCPYFYLPGGRVKIGETAEEALKREVREELGVSASIIRPLWLNQAFFTEDVDRRRYHELCLYFLMEIPETEPLPSGDGFTTTEGGRTHCFEWLEFGRLKDEYFYPQFLKKDIFRLPEEFSIRTERE